MHHVPFGRIRHARIFRAAASRVFPAVLLLLLAGPLHAQDRRPLEIADYRLWRTIEDATISDDGRWSSWTYAKVRGDDTLHVRGLDSDTRREVPRASGGAFSSDGRWIAYTIDAGFLEIERAEREGDGESVTTQVGLMNLATGETIAWDAAVDFGFSQTSSHFYVRKRPADSNAEHDGTDFILRNLS